MFWSCICYLLQKSSLWHAYDCGKYPGSSFFEANFPSLELLASVSSPQEWQTGRRSAKPPAGCLCRHFSSHRWAPKDKHATYRTEGQVQVCFCARCSHLWAGQNDGFTQVFAHEGQGGGCVGHSVGTVEDHEAVKVLVVLLQTRTSRTELIFAFANKWDQLTLKNNNLDAASPRCPSRFDPSRLWSCWRSPAEDCTPARCRWSSCCLYSAWGRQTLTYELLLIYRGIIRDMASVLVSAHTHTQGLFTIIWNKVGFFWKSSQTKIMGAKSRAYWLYLAGLRTNISSWLPAEWSGVEGVWGAYVSCRAALLLAWRERCSRTWVASVNGGGGVTAKADFHSEDKHRIHTYLCQLEEDFQLWVPHVNLWVKLCGLAEWLEAHFWSS